MFSTSRLLALAALQITLAAPAQAAAAAPANCDAAADAVRAGVRDALGLSGSVSDAALAERIRALRDDVKNHEQADSKKVALAVKAFHGVWLANRGEPWAPAGDECRVVLRISDQPARILRAIVCANGSIQTDSAPILRVDTEASRFPGGFQLTVQPGAMSSSCKGDAKSRFPGLTAPSFDLKTGSGADAASYAFSAFGDRELVFFSGGALDELARTRDCETLVQRAQDSDSAANSLLRLAINVCQAEQQTAGCHTNGGFVPSR